jgi:hypothetical protein
MDIDHHVPPAILHGASHLVVVIETALGDTVLYGDVVRYIMAETQAYRHGNGLSG